MTPERAKQLGAFVQTRRVALGLSQRELARRAGLTDVVRLEHGLITHPRSETLAALAEALEVTVGDLVYAAHHDMAKQLPSFTPYLRAKYRDLPEEAVSEMSAFFERLAREHGVSGPERGEDETPDD